MTSQRKKLPIGIQTFEKIRSDNYYYIDKTQWAMDLLNSGGHYFLSRPRRFGKSLFLDTLKELAEGNETLFNNLIAHQQWDWSIKYPVLRFSFGSGYYLEPDGLKTNIQERLDELEEYYNFSSKNTTTSGRFKALIRYLNQQTGQRVVILVDEYDKPILDALQEPEMAKANRNYLRSFYATVKDYDGYIKCSFFTGVSKFSKVSIFSGLNNLTDLTLDRRYSALCGYTDHDIETVFKPELNGLDREQIRSWYNGYNWLGEGVYNPFDILQLFDKREFRHYWFESGTPTFLINWLMDNQVPSPILEKMFTSSDMLTSYDVDHIDTEALLFQTGYLTIKQEQNLGGEFYYTLGYPNREVEQSLNRQLLSSLVKNKTKQANNTIQLYQLLQNNDFDALKNLFQSFFASIPHHWYTHNDIQTYEGYYASVFYSYFASLGLNITVEDVTNLGRIDMTLQFNKQVYIFEFKVVELVPEGKAIEQIKNKGYADKFKALNQPIYLIGVEFSKDNRNIISFDIEQG